MTLSKGNATTLDSLAKMGARLNRNRSTVYRLTRRPDWPIAPRPPWSEADALIAERWCRGLQEDRSKPPAPGSTRERIELARAAKTEIEVDILRGSVVPADALTRAMAGLLSVFVGELEELARTLPASLSDLDPGQVEAKVGEQVRAVRQRLADRRTIELAETTRHASGPVHNPARRG